MIYSAQCAYAMRALTRLALTTPDGFVRLDELCAGTEMPKHFVGKIFQELVRHGLLSSAKGRGGGFKLARTPQDIALYEIVAIIDGTRKFEECVVGLAQCDGTQPCPLHDEWSQIRSRIELYLMDTTLEQITRASKKQSS